MTDPVPAHGGDPGTHDDRHGDAALATAEAAVGAPILDLLNGFIGELREAGLPVSLTENLDAMEAIRHIPLEDRETFKYALAATLVKNNAHWRSFETVFEVYFSLRGAKYGMDDEGLDDDLADLLEDERDGAGDQGSGQSGQGGGDALSPEELQALLYQAMMKGDEALMRAIARQAVKRFAGMEPGRPVGGTYYLYRTLRNLDLDGLLEKMMEQRRQQASDDGEALSQLEEHLERDEYEHRIDAMKKEVEAEIRRRLVADRGIEAMAKTLRKPLPEDVDFMHASREEMVGLRKALQPLTRRLAVRLARKRRHNRRGPLDFRRTVRASLSYGGVPAEPKFRYPRPHKPEIFVVADISGSVAAFARFTLMLVYAISGQFSKVRSFVFIDGIDEVTSYFEGVEDVTEAVHRVNTEADVVWVDGHSDYGHAFEVFQQRWGKEIGPKTTVIILGDARNNYHASQSWVVKEMQHRARHVYWLNPEPRSYWDTGDSIVGDYGAHCDGVFECRNLRQLEKFVENLA
ncbi:VWA domain-containing protein [soil metagenome]